MFEAKLRIGTESMGIALTEEAARRMGVFHKMLMDANRRMNLTRVPEDEDESIARHYLDSLSPLAHEDFFAGRSSMIDVGSGAGFPGIPLAIARPELRITMLDSLSKRVQFLKEVIDALSLNARVIHGRAEDCARQEAHRDQYDLATARAVAGLPVLLELTTPFLRSGGLFIAYKGPSAGEEVSAAERAASLLGARFSLNLAAPIPGRDWAHHLVAYEKLGPTPSAYPRRAGTPERKPL